MVTISHKKTTMQDIADALGISKAAVSIALSDKPGISDALRKEIYNTAMDLGYFKNYKNVNANNNLLLIIDDGRDNDSEFFFPIISETLRYGEKKGYKVLITNVSAKLQENQVIPQIYYDVEPRGVLFLGNIKKEFLHKFIDIGIPSVLMVQHIYGLPIDNVLSANEDGAYIVTKHLIDCGHRRIGYIADVSVFETFSMRLTGYRKALREAGIYTGEYEYVFCSTGEKPSKSIIGPHMDKITSYREQPTAWVCGNDPTAITLINEFRERGISVPEDVSIVGFDGVQSAANFNPPITTYDARIDLIAQYSIDLIISHIENGDKGWNPVNISILGELIEGRSVQVLEK